MFQYMEDMFEASPEDGSASSGNFSISRDAPNILSRNHRPRHRRIFVSPRQAKTAGAHLKAIQQQSGRNIAQRRRFGAAPKPASLLAQLSGYLPGGR